MICAETGTLVGNKEQGCVRPEFSSLLMGINVFDSVAQKYTTSGALNGGSPTSPVNFKK